MMIKKEMPPDSAHAGEKRCRASSIFRRCMILLLVLLFQASAHPAAAQNKLTKLDPESLVVHLENGSGLADATFALEKGINVPEFKVTPAVGNSNTIPAENITFKWVKDPQTQPGAESQPSARGPVLAGQISVNTRINIEPDTNYTGRIIFYWPDATPPVIVNFTVSDRMTLAFSLTPTKFDLALAQSQPDAILLRVKNTGRVPIQKLSVSSSDLIDSETQHRLVLPEREVKDFGSTPLAPLREAEFSFNVPELHWAGSYSGTVDVIVNQSSRQSIPFVIRSRGPIISSSTYWLPFILFVATLLLGYLVSNMLENWFNLGGLQRAEAQLSLRKSERELARIAEQVEMWATVPLADAFAQTRIRLQQDLNELGELYRRIPGLTREELVAETKRFATFATLAGIFESAVNVALKQWPDPPKLNQVLTLLDRVAPGTDPNAYRTSLRTVLETEAKLNTDDAKANAFDASAALPDVPSPADLEKKIKRMAQLERLVAATVVFIMAYQLFYAKDFAFGTLLDYLGVFLWSLGLTQMGTQLIARARSSYTPTQ